MEQPCFNVHRLATRDGAESAVITEEERDKISDRMLSSNTVSKTILDEPGRVKSTSTRAKSTRAVMSLTIGTVAGRGMRFVRSMILARILVSDQIGIMAIVMCFSVALETLTEVGVKQSVIQNKEGANPAYLNMAWWTQLVRGLSFFGIAFFVAPWIGSFYDKPQLVSLLRVAFLAIVFRALVSPRAYVLEKEYKFGRAVFLMQGSVVLGTILTVVLAFMMRNVWALVIGFVSEMAIMCLLSFILVPFRPRFEIDKKSLAELMKFARGMFGLPVLTMLSLQGPVLILGKVIPNSELGLYFYAATLALFPVDMYTKIISPVLLPAFSEKQDDNRNLCRRLLHTTQWTASFVLPLIAFMICCAPELLLFAFGGEYVAMVVPYAVLCLQVLLRNEAGVLTGMYLAVGRPNLQRRFALIRAVAIVGLLYPTALYFGTLGVAVLIVSCSIVVLSMQAFVCRKVINLRLDRYVRCYVHGLLLALPIIAVFDILWLLKIDNQVLVVAVGAFTFISTFAAGALILRHNKLRTAVIGTFSDRLKLHRLSEA